MFECRVIELLDGYHSLIHSAKHSLIQ